MALFLKSRIEKTLDTLAHPRTGDGLLASGVVQSILVENGQAVVTLAIDAQDADAMAAVRTEAEAIIAGLSGVRSAKVVMTAERTPGAPAPQPPAPPPDPRPTPRPPTPTQIPGVRHVIAIASGKGGVGKSTTSVNLAYALARQGLRTGLVDLDIYGPSIAHMLRLEGRPEVDTNKRIRPVFRDDIATMTMGLLIDVEQAAVWRGPMVMKATQQLLMEVAWDERGPLDVLVADLPPGTGDVQLTLAQTAELSGAIIVSTPQDLALIDARKAKNMFNKVNVPVLGVIENMSYFACPHCGERSDIFGHGGAAKAAEAAGLELIGEIPLHMSIREAGDAGTPLTLANTDSTEARAYAAVAEKLAAKLAQPD